MNAVAGRGDAAGWPRRAGLGHAAAGSATPTELVPIAGADTWLARQGAVTKDWCAALGFRATPGSVIFVPDATGRLARVVATYDEADGMWAAAGLPGTLPAGVYRLTPHLPPRRATAVALGWALGAYRFRGDSCLDRATLSWPAHADRAGVERLARVRLEGSRITAELVAAFRSRATVSPLVLEFVSLVRTALNERGETNGQSVKRLKQGTRRRRR